MKHFREEEHSLSLSLSLSTDSTESPPSSKKVWRRPAKSGDGEFVCKTCNRAFTSFQALGGHRTSHMRGRQGLGLLLGAEKVLKQKDKARHECHICGLGFEMGQALGGHMRRHRDEAHGSGDWARLSLGRLEGFGSDSPPVLLELFA